MILHHLSVAPDDWLMETRPVAVSTADVVMVKTEEDDPNDSGKTQVILQLQPITQGVSEDPGEMGTAIVAVETHNEDGSADGDEVEYGYPITCGDSRAVLLFKKFVCPGINVKCVKFNEQLISPKQFVHLAGKATLKDWKRAIRLGGVMLRKMMDSGQIDFYQHDTVCTNTCRSTKFDLLISNTRIPPQASALPAPTSPQGNGGQVVVVEDPSAETVAVATDWSPSVATAITVATDESIKNEVGDISEETLSFWKSIAEVGLMGEVVSNIRTELLALLRRVQLRSGQEALQEPDAAVLNSLARMFGLLGSVKRALETRLSQADQNQEQGLHSTLTSLEQQLEEQRKQVCDWPQQQSQAYPSVLLMSLGGEGSKPPAPKRPRLHLSGPTPGPALEPSLPPQQLGLISPITLTPTGQPYAVSGLPTGSRVLTCYTVAKPGQQGAALSTVEREPEEVKTERREQGEILVMEEEPQKQSQAE
ncbi:hypothetical protein AGOR_G00120570 [Albula goreensis]|uniref:SAND domain-containing protein n=1 Tax=Albula goreensis TaxID=1534307 RepID=A0A8T3DKT8_9TELE|nr:hypothetical protein AGOR_G00120570 [Albula goreensis]